MKCFFCLLLLLSSIQHAFAQQLKGIIYNKEFVGSLGLHSNGWQFGMYRGKIATFNKTNYYAFDFREYVHPREQRQSFEGVVSIQDQLPKSFKFAKQNNFYAVDASLGRKQYISDATKKVAVALNYSGGVSLGLLKPYYLTLLIEDTNTGSFEFVDTKYTPATKDYFLSEDLIYGGAGFFTGLNETKLIPGVTGKVSLLLDFGAYAKFVKQLEGGVGFNIYTTDIKLMVDEPSKPYFINLFVNIGLGSRWN